MAKYIDCEALREAMYHQAFETDTPMQRWDSGCWIRYKMFENAIEAAPAADVQPVRHGRWIETTQPMGWSDVTCAECSECGEDFVLDEWGMDDMKNLMLYCPNCGADMREAGQ